MEWLKAFWERYTSDADYFLKLNVIVMIGMATYSLVSLDVGKDGQALTSGLSAAVAYIANVLMIMFGDDDGDK